MAEQENEGLARSNLDNSLQGLLRKLGEPQDYELWITGQGNFRFNIYPEYKANRLKTPRPRFLEACRQHLMTAHGAYMSDGCEADDMLGIGQCMAEDETMISSIDKDLLMIPGWHFIPELTRLGKVLREEKRVLISPSEALHFFYTQLITGDSTDNIKGVRGAGKVAARLSLRTDGAEFNESAALAEVRRLYDNDQELEMNARCLWIQRKPNENIVERWKELFGYENMDAS